MGDFLPRLLSPHVRLELIHWHPLADPSLNSMQFIPALFEEHPNPSMGDSLLIPQVLPKRIPVRSSTPNQPLYPPQLVAAVVVPRLLHALANEVQPLNTAQSRRMALVIEDAGQSRSSFACT
jgi:hypothetical protein